MSHPNDSTREFLVEAVEELGHSVAGVGSSRTELESHCVNSPPHLIISGVQYPDGDGIEGLIQISESVLVPSIVVTEVSDLDRVERATDDHVMAYLIEPIEVVDLKPTILVVRRRFEQLEALESEVSDLKQALATRKRLERAKGILMAKNNWTEEEAYLHIRDTATSNRKKIAEVSESIIEETASENDSADVA